MTHVMGKKNTSFAIFYFNFALSILNRKQYLMRDKAEVLIHGLNFQSNQPNDIRQVTMTYQYSPVGKQFITFLTNTIAEQAGGHCLKRRTYRM